MDRRGLRTSRDFISFVFAGAQAPVFAGVAQLVERQPSKLNVAGSSPVSRSGEGEAPALFRCRGFDVSTPERAWK